MEQEQVQQTTVKHTTMVTMDYIFNEEDGGDTDDENTEDTTEANKDQTLKILPKIAGADPEQTTPEISSNHSVQWLTEEGDILVPVVDHETTTMMKIGHLDGTELDVETTPRDQC